MRNVSTSLVVMFLGMLTACHKSSGAEPTGGGRGHDENQKVFVTTQTATKAIIPQSISVVAPLLGISHVDVYSKFVGRVSYMGPHEGDHVAQGAELFRIDRNDPGESFLSAPVVSPIKGWVGRWSITNIGQHITGQDAVVTIVDDTSLRATIYLPLESWMLIRKDTVVRIEAAGSTRTGTILTIARSADLASGRGSATINVSNEDRSWRDGMIAKITLDLDPRKRMVLSAKALTITDQGAFMYAIEGDKVKRAKVHFELIDSDHVEILDGITENAQVVISGNNLLSEKSQVAIVNGPSTVVKSGKSEGAFKQ